MEKRMRFALFGVCATVLAVASAPSAAQDAYPAKPVRIIAPFPPGGSTDVLCRIIAQKLTTSLGRQLIVDNRPGAGGSIGHDVAARAPADGYTLLTTTSALAVNHTASKNKGFETSDLRPVAFVAYSPDVLAVHPDNPAKNLKEFIAAAKIKSFTYGSAGPGTGPQIGAEYFFQEVAKVKYVHVPFQGGAPAITAVLGNHVDSIVLTLPPVTPQIQNGKLRGLGVANETRNKAITDVPTYGEMGFPNVYSGSWVGVFAPAKTPDAIVAKLNAEINAAMKDADALDRLAKAGFDTVVKNVAESNGYFKIEIERWATMVKAVGFSN